MREAAKCGTYPGYQKHRTDKTPPCDPCREACRLYSADRIAQNPRAKAQNRWQSTIRSAAMRKLAKEYPQRFRQLLDAEREAHPWSPPEA